MRNIFLLILIVGMLSIKSYSQTNDGTNDRKVRPILFELNKLGYDKIDYVSFELAGSKHFLGHSPIPKHIQSLLPEIQYNYLDSISTTAIESEVEYILTQDCKIYNDTILFSPVAVYWDMNKNKTTIQYKDEDEYLITLSYISAADKEIYVTVFKHNHTINSAAIAHKMPMSNDTYFLEKYLYFEYKKEDGFYLPAKLGIFDPWNETNCRLNYQNQRLVR